MKLLICLALNLIPWLFPFAQEEPGRFLGVINDSLGCSPLSHVEVAFIQDEEAVLTTTTNADGLFVMDSVSAGEYELRLSFYGHTVGTDRPVRIMEGSTTFLEINMKEGEISTDVEASDEELFEEAEKRKDKMKFVENSVKILGLIFQEVYAVRKLMN